MITNQKLQKNFHIIAKIQEGRMLQQTFADFANDAVNMHQKRSIVHSSVRSTQPCILVGSLNQVCVPVSFVWVKVGMSLVERDLP